jgi:antirestriction protein ArdC
MTKHHRQAAPERASLYDDITNKIIAELEDGRLPWVQPWGTPRRGAAIPGSTS